MAAKPLDLTIMRRGRRQQVINVTADPDDVPKLRQSLVGWLEGGGWDEGLWPQFYAEVRLTTSGRLLKRVST